MWRRHWLVVQCVVGGWLFSVQGSDYKGWETILTLYWSSPIYKSQNTNLSVALLYSVLDLARLSDTDWRFFIELWNLCNFQNFVINREPAGFNVFQSQSNSSTGLYKQGGSVWFIVISRRELSLSHIPVYTGYDVTLLVWCTMLHPALRASSQQDDCRPHVLLYTLDYCMFVSLVMCDRKLHCPIWQVRSKHSSFHSVQWVWILLIV